MFTGLVESVGRVESLKNTVGGARMRVRCPDLAPDLRLGDSVAVNGACLTVMSTQRTDMSVDLSTETLRRTSFNRLRPGHQVNLERAMPADGRLGGHFVNGHIDGVSHVLSIIPTGEYAVWRFKLDADLLRYVVEKGSIAVDGVSLTVSCVDKDHFDVSLIPTTLASTTFSSLREGDPVNIEVDVLAKYVENLLQSKITQRENTRKEQRLRDSLRQHGFFPSETDGVHFD